MLPPFLQVGFLFLLWLEFLPYVLGLKGDSGCNPFICVNATLHDDDWITYEVASVYEPLGWLALGFGRKMDHTQMVIMWPDEDGNVVRSQRFGWGHEEPSPLLNPKRHAFPKDPVATSWLPTPNSIRMAFNMTANRTELEVNPIEELIWAYSMTRPSGEARSQLMPHYRAGRIRVDYRKEVVVPPPPGAHPSIVSPTPQKPNTDIMIEGGSGTGIFDDDSVPWGDHEKFIVVHAVLITFGFLVLLPSGSLIARWTRTITPNWFKAHSIINMTCALPIILIGWLFGPVAVANHDAPHFMTVHQICGVFLLVLYLLQVGLGRYIHRRRAAGLVPSNKHHPPSNILHVLMGISVITFAFVQVRSGLNEWETATTRGPLHSWCHNLWLAWCLIVPFAYLVGLSLIPRQFYQERQNIVPGGDKTAYVVLPDGADSPLLDEDRQDHEVYEARGGQFKNSQLSLQTIKVEAAGK